MICPGCGKKVRDGIKFCPHCGVALPETPAAAEHPAEPILGTTKKKRGGAFLAVIVGVVLVAAVLVMGVAGIFTSPKAAVGKAMVKSAKELTAVSQVLGVDTVREMGKNGTYSQSFAAGVKKVPASLVSGLDPALLEGLKGSWNWNVNLPEQAMDATLDLHYGSVEVAECSVSAENELIALSLPQFLGSTTYAANTTTLGKDLQKLLPGEDVPDISFQLFDLIDSYRKQLVLDEEANQALLDAIEVEKLDKTDVDVNEATLSCKTYQVLIPKDAMKTWVNSVETAVEELGYDSAAEELYRSMGYSKEEAKAAKAQMKESQEEFFDDCREILKEVGDLDLVVYLNDGYVVSAEWDEDINGSDINVQVDVGGEEHYADALTVEIEADSSTMTIVSSGDHTADSGIFTDTTEVTLDGETFLTSEIEYDGTVEEDNFSWDLSSPENTISLNAEGTFLTSPDTWSMDLDHFALKSNGEELVLDLSCALKPYEKNFSTEDSVLLSEMDQTDLAELSAQVEEHTQAWILGLIQQIPALQTLIQSLFL